MKKELNRRNFLRTSALALAGAAIGCDRYNPANIIVPKGNINDFLNQYTPVVEDLANEGKEPSSFLLETMLSDAQAVSTNYSSNEGPKANNSGSMLASTTIQGDADGNGSINIFDLLRILKDLRNPIPSPASDVDGNGVVNIFDVLDFLKIMNGTYNTNLVKGVHFDNDSEIGIPAEMTINGQTFYAGQNGLFSTRLPKSQDFLITAKQENGFKRTVELPEGDYASLNLFSVSYPTQEGVAPELFKQFCQKACFDKVPNGFWYWGLKTGLKNPNARFWISSHGDSATYSEGGKSTIEDQLYVKSVIENDIYPHLRPEYHFPIYLEDPNSIETIPFGQEGVYAIVPRDSPSFGIGVVDTNRDGIANHSIIYLPNGHWNETYKPEILEETFSSLVGVGEVSGEYGVREGDEWTAYSVLATMGDPKLTQSDDKLINIQHRYKPLENIENILG